MQTPNISLCMIMRNEDAVLADCLNSVGSLVTEIIIVDTGSTDTSVAIAKNFGAKVFDYKWENNFSEPRNYGIDKAVGEWILVLDADEVIAPDSHAIIRKLCLNPKLCYLLTQRHYTKNPSIQGFTACCGEHADLERDSPGYFESSLVRFFPNSKKIRYRNRIHELVEPSIKDCPEFKIVNSEVRLHHYGHLKPEKTLAQKARLYTELGEQKAVETPSDWKALYEIGIEHNCNGRLIESAKAFAKSAELNPNYVNLWVNYGYVLCELGQYKNAITALERAIKLEAGNSEAWCNLGVVYLRLNRSLLAEEAFKAAIAFSKNYINAWNNLGDAYLNSAKPTQAVWAFESSLKILTQNEKAKEGLGIASFMLGNFARAEICLSQGGSTPRKDFWLSQLRRLTTQVSASQIT